MMQPKATIIVPVYNGSRFVKNCFIQFQKQTIKEEIELIFVNDGSRDGTGEICDILVSEDNRCSVYHQEHSGVSAARNLGMKYARGEYIGFIDVDDNYDNDLIERLYFLIQDYNADVSCLDPIGNAGDIILMDNPGKALRMFFKPRGGLKGSVYPKLFARYICEKIQFLEDKKIYEDYFFVYQALSISRVTVNQNFSKYHYIKHNNSSSRQNFAMKNFDAIYVVDEIVAMTKINFPNLISDAIGFKMAIYIRVMKLYYLRKGRGKFIKEINDIKSYIYSFDKAMIDKYLIPTNKIRYFTYRYFRPLFILMIHTVDNN